MAKKSRTPAAPRVKSQQRPVQAPQKRVQTPQRRGDPTGGSRKLWLIGGAVLALAAAAIVVGVVVFASGTPASTTIRDGGYTLETFPAQGRQHVNELGEDFEYNSDPPTTGPHFPVAAPWGAYDDPIEQFRLVHNQEHGGVIVQYGDEVPQQEIDAILAWWRSDPDGIVVAPYPSLGRQIALGAWVAPDDGSPGEGVVAKGTAFDESVFDAFKDGYGFRGPERFERGELRPGH